MKKMSKLVMAAILAVALQGTAMATVELENTAAPGTKTYALELVKVGTTVFNSTGPDSNFDVNGTLGYGVSQNQDRIMRFDLTGATLNKALVNGDLTLKHANGTAANASVTLISGGGVGATNVSFQITPQDTSGLAQDSIFALNIDEFKKIIDKGSVGIAYSLYQFGYQANNYPSTEGRYTLKTANLANFATALQFTTTPETNTAEVAKLFKEFSNGPSENLAAATLNLVSAPIPLSPATNGAAAYGDIVATGSKLIMTGTGSLASASKVFIDIGGEGCGATPSGGDVNGTISGQTVTFPVDGANPFTAKNICYVANTVDQIAEQKFTIDTDLTATANAEITDMTGKDAGTIIRNGTTLRAPFIEKSAFLHLTNTSGTLAAPFTVTCFGPNDAPFAGTGSTLAAGKTKKLWVSDLCGKDKTVNAVEFILDVPSGTVTGTFVRQNSSTGDTSADTMITK